MTFRLIGAVDSGLVRLASVKVSWLLAVMVEGVLGKLLRVN